MKLTLRPYQQEAIDALDKYLCEHEDNPCVVIPTGGGKSLIMAEAIRRWRADYPPFRCIVLAHRKELVKQNSAEFMQADPEADIGVYSSGLHMRQANRKITFAGIDSVYNKALSFEPFDMIIVDEAHRIPTSGDGKYRKFIADCKLVNPNVRIAGFTATPYRLGCGPVCHKDHILNAICYEADVGKLIDDGYLCKLRSKCGEAAPDLENVRRQGRGDYVVNELAKAVNNDNLIRNSVTDALAHIRAENRRSVIWFCVDVAHTEAVRMELVNQGVYAKSVTGHTPDAERDRIVRDFDQRRFQHLCNCNCFTEGFNVKHVDCIVLLRPTLSKGLYVQMVGRGLRLHPDKTDCLILDYARCIETHGPIDCIDGGRVRLATCQKCRNVFSWAVRKCPECGWEIPKQEIETVEREERERKMHEERAAQLAILGREPETLEVDDVSISRHVKEGSPDSLRVTYRCGLRTFSEWLCFGHEGYARQKAAAWWAARFVGLPPSVDEACQDLWLASRIKARTKTITVVKRGQYWEIIDFELQHQ